MREIKFRACCYINTDKMVYGTGVFDDGYNTWLNYLKPKSPLAFGMVEQIVQPDTIGQFTGLRDKNDQPIFEGDIVAAWDEYPRVVEWCIDEACFKARHLPDHKYLDPLYMSEGPFIILGNIHENKELLK